MSEPAMTMADLHRILRRGKHLPPEPGWQPATPPRNRRYVCTDLFRHPITEAGWPRGEDGEHPDFITSRQRQEYRCTYVYPNGRPCPCTLRLGMRMMGRVMGYEEALGDALAGLGINDAEIDISLLAWWLSRSPR